MSSSPKERPILFNAEMVRAIIDGRKTQTRRVFAPEKMTWTDDGRYQTHAIQGGELVLSGSGPFIASDWLHYCPYGVPGDRLWVREACQAGESEQGHPGVYYPTTSDWRWGADDAEWDKLWKYAGDRGRTVPSIHMPRWASRILLEVTDVRVERVQEISAADVVAEGLRTIRHGHPLTAFSELWNSTTKPGQQWGDNPWVWCVSFKVLEGGADHA